jgi:hypothetical protein
LASLLTPTLSTQIAHTVVSVIVVRSAGATDDPTAYDFISPRPSALGLVREGPHPSGPRPAWASGRTRSALTAPPWPWRLFELANRAPPGIATPVSRRPPPIRRPRPSRRTAAEGFLGFRPAPHTGVGCSHGSRGRSRKWRS